MVKDTIYKLWQQASVSNKNPNQIRFSWRFRKKPRRLKQFRH